MQIEIAPLRGLGHLSTTLAAWHVAEWGHLYDPAIWNYEISVAEFDAIAAGSTTDQTWVAFNGPSRSDADVLGSVSLLVDHALADAESSGVARVHLFTAGQEQYYLERGWRTIKQIEHCGEQAAVMVHTSRPK